MSLKHLGPGSQNPPLKKGTLRLYSVALSPFAHRVRLVLAAKKIPYEVVNIKTRAKPEWYEQVNPLGQVPCLQFDDGRVLPESLIISEYLDEAYPENRLSPSDPYTRADQRVIVEMFSKAIIAFYSLLLNENEDKSNFLAIFDSIEKRLVNDYFGGDKPRMVDYMIWPWMERTHMLKSIRQIEIDEVRFPRLNAYIKRMLTHPPVKELYIPPEIHFKFYEQYLSGQMPDYDLGLLDQF